MVCVQLAVVVVIWIYTARYVNICGERTAKNTKNVAEEAIVLADVVTRVMADAVMADVVTRVMADAVTRVMADVVTRGLM
ncbi:hypothetical protein EMCRGX_G011960 [Ephydatia muelleri]